MNIQSNINSIMGLLGNTALMIKGGKFLQRDEEAAKAQKKQAEIEEKEYLYETASSNAQEPTTAAEAKSQANIARKGVAAAEAAYAASPSEQTRENLLWRESDLEGYEEAEAKFAREEEIAHKEKIARAEVNARLAAEDEYNRLRKSREIQERIMRGGI